MKQRMLRDEESALIVIDVQEKLFPLVEHPCEMLEQIQKLIKGCSLFKLPIIISEQYPQGLGKTIEPIRSLIADFEAHQKTTFSCMGDPALATEIVSKKRNQWIVCGIEAHVCIFQTVRGLLELGMEVVVANNAISSRSIYDFSTAIAEIRDLGARIASVETILFELMRDSSRPEFRALSALIKS